MKEAVKATRNALHGGRTYLEGERRGRNGWSRCGARPLTPRTFRDTCLRIMGRHASTRERLPILHRFYVDALAGFLPYGPSRTSDADEPAGDSVDAARRDADTSLPMRAATCGLLREFIPLAACGQAAACDAGRAPPDAGRTWRWS